jgi:hypothetical protein
MNPLADTTHVIFGDVCDCGRSPCPSAHLRRPCGGHHRRRESSLTPMRRFGAARLRGQARPWGWRRPRASGKARTPRRRHTRNTYPFFRCENCGKFMAMTEIASRALADLRRFAKAKNRALALDNPKRRADLADPLYGNEPRPSRCSHAERGVFRAVSGFVQSKAKLFLAMLHASNASCGSFLSGDCALTPEMRLSTPQAPKNPDIHRT